MAKTSTGSARTSARALLDHFGVQTPVDIDLYKFAHHLGANVEIAPLDGAEAQLLRTKGATTIILADRITDEPTMRFNLAHELGHLILSHPSPSNANELTCKPQGRTIGRERQASACGSELLMPDNQVRPLCCVHSVDLGPSMRIARDFIVALEASAIRFTQLTHERCAAVFCVDGVVKWCAASRRFRKRIRRRAPLDRGSIAFHFFASGELEDSPQRVAAKAWFPAKKNVDIVEHTICDPKRGTTLSMLWIPEPSAEALGMRT